MGNLTGRMATKGSVLSIPNIVSVQSSVLPTGAATSAKQDTLLTELQLKADLTETQPVSISTMPSTPVTGTFWQTTQPVSFTGSTDVATQTTLAAINTKMVTGTDIGDVTVNNLTSTPVYTDHSITGIGHGVKTVTTAGTDVALAASTPCKKVDIQAMDTNTGRIAVGGSGVDATSGTGTGILLYAGDVYSLEISNLANVYIDSTVNAEKVRFTYFT